MSLIEWMPRAEIFCISVEYQSFICFQCVASVVLYVAPCPNSYFITEHVAEFPFAVSREGFGQGTMVSFATPQDQAGHTELSPFSFELF
jgi:hypothetical protein